MKAHLRSLQQAFAIAHHQSQDFDMPEQYRKHFAGIANLLWDSLGKDKEVTPSAVPEPQIIARLRGLTRELYVATSRDEAAELGQRLFKAQVAWQTVRDEGNYIVCVTPEDQVRAVRVRDSWLGVRA